MRKPDWKRIALALIFALIAGAASALLYLNRDFFFEWQRVKAEGAFSASEDPELHANAVKLAEEKIARPGAVCVSQWLGRDDAFIYLALGCARFERKQQGITAEGDQNFIPTRFRYYGKDVEKWEQPNLGEYDNSMRRLFPREAMAALTGRRNQELYLKLGVGKQTP